MPIGFANQVAQIASGSTESLVGSGDKGSFVEPYTTDNTNWFKSKPYGFSFYDVNSNGEVASSTIYLPISPNNLSITTNFATNIVTTLYGVVEEHSEIRYYDIVISGTTGIAPRYVGETSEGEVRSSGRSQFDPSGLSLGGFLPEVTNTINQIADTFTSISNTLTGTSNNPTGVTPDQSGYAAFHKLYKFLHKYKQDAAGINTAAGSGSSAASKAISAAKNFIGSAAGGASSGPTRQVHPLRFLNYKDGNQYDCIPISFTMNRSADNPMLYNYNIKLRAFNLRSVDDDGFPAEDQLAKLGLGSLEGQSLFAGLTATSGNAATLISGLL